MDQCVATALTIEWALRRTTGGDGVNPAATGPLSLHPFLVPLRGTLSFSNRPVDLNPIF